MDVLSFLLQTLIRAEVIGVFFTKKFATFFGLEVIGCFGFFGTLDV